MAVVCLAGSRRWLAWGLLLKGRLRCATLSRLRSAPAAEFLTADDSRGEDASEGGSRTDGTYSLDSVRERRVGLCPVGRSLSRASSSLGLMPTCTDSATPGLATFLEGRRPITA